MIRILLFFCLLFLFSTLKLSARQDSFILHDVKVIGEKDLDSRSILNSAGLYSGQKITDSDGKIAAAIKRLWKLDVFEDVSIYRDPQNPDDLIISVELSPRLTSFHWVGFGKKESGQLDEKLSLSKGRRLTPTVRKKIKNTIQNYFIDKGYQNAIATLKIQKDGNLADLSVSVDRGAKLKVKNVKLVGNDSIPYKKLKKSFKPYLKSFGLFSQVYKEDAKIEVEANLKEYYANKGFADFAVTGEKAFIDSKGKVSIELELSEGKRYYVRNIQWQGNSKYSEEQLFTLSGLKKGMVYSYQHIEEALRFKRDGTDISSLYMNDGYLLFNIRQEVTAVDDNQVDLMITMKEGKPAIISDIRIEGNNITNQHVLLRQLSTLPGDQFNRKELFRSQANIANLGFFDPNTIDVKPIPNPHNNTVDLVYIVEEKPNDKYEFTGTFNGTIGFTGGIGLELNNFASKDLFKLKNWKTFPRGDGERLALRYNTAGKSFNSFTFNYSNPWMKSERQKSFFINSNYSRLIRPQTDENGIVTDGSLVILGGSVGTSKRLIWKDPFFSFTQSVSYHNYRFDGYDNSLAIDKGQTHLLTFNNTLSRNTIDHPFYPSVGSQFSASLSLTPPFSFFNTVSDDGNPYKFAEFMKLMVDYSKYKRLAGKLTLKVGAHFGLLENYSGNIPLGPFERFHLGGTGLNGQDFFRGNDLIGLRGYPAESLVPFNEATGIEGGTIYEKFNVELRHPVILNASYSAYMYGFFEAGNTWGSRKDFRPLDLYKSAGVGMRFSLPFVGQFGLDWAYGFDKLPGETRPSGSQFHFTIGMPIR